MDQRRLAGARNAIDQHYLALEDPMVELFNFSLAAEEYLAVVFGVAVEKLKRRFHISTLL
jgi:hypothetical protein